MAPHEDDPLAHACVARRPTADTPPASPRHDADHDGLSPRYEFRGTLGAGGLGIVLEALDDETRRVVAIKRPRGGGARP